jgi:hypothetical protein
MQISTQYVTISCDSCDKQVTFNEADAQQAAHENPWLRSVRLFQLFGTRLTRSYCSDECVLKAIQDNQLAPEPSRVSLAEGSLALDAAKAEARTAMEANKAMRQGKGLSVVR